jgi:hypothetical protein
VYCQLEDLSTCMDITAVREVLRKLPKDLNETYDRILQNIPHTRVSNAIKLLQLLMVAARPLLLEEVEDAIATEPDVEPPFTFKDRIYPPHAVIGYCPNLVRITTTNERMYSDGLDDGRAANGARTTIQLAHFSVQEYLVAHRKENPHHGSFASQVANTKVTQICFAYLWAVAEALKTRQSVAEFAFIEYAAKEWTEHAQIAGDSEESTFTWTKRFFTNERVF